jgi:hypothetical protein
VRRRVTSVEGRDFIGVQTVETYSKGILKRQTWLAMPGLRPVGQTGKARVMKLSAVSAQLQARRGATVFKIKPRRRKFLVAKGFLF